MISNILVNVLVELSVDMIIFFFANLVIICILSLGRKDLAIPVHL